MGGSRPAATDESATISEEEEEEDDDATIESDNDVNSDNKNDAVESPPPSDSSPFHEGEKVIAFHSQRLYEAKVQKIDFREKEWKYFLHYLGWNKNWDEWVSLDLLMKYNDENIKKLQSLNKKRGMEKRLKPARAKPNTSAGVRGKRRKSDSVLKEKRPTGKLVNIQIPSTLKKQLVDDCEFITQFGKLVKLPRKPNVDEIFNMYLTYRTKKDGIVSDSVKEILNGLRCYFDKALAAMLLYKSERRQYHEAVAENVSPSTVYGAEHLLRLFVKLPEILYCANIEEETMEELRQKLLDFLKFLRKNHSAFFLTDYLPSEVSDPIIKKQDN